MNKSIAIIGASYLQLPLIEKAKKLGYKTHVFAWAANDVGEKSADFFYPISIVEKEKIKDVCKKIGICGICSIASDLAAVTVNYVAKELGLVGNDMDCVYRSTNKHLMRESFAKNGDPSPKSILVDNTTDLEKLVLEYPIIVKPTDRSGSRGICKLNSFTGLPSAVSIACSESLENKALIEEYIDGTEYSVEGISYRGEHHVLAMTLKHTTGAPHFIETGHLEPAPIDAETYKRIEKVVKHALDSLGIKNGASHSEIKITGDGTIKIIEIGGRMGGDCIGSDLVELSTGIDYVKAVIDIACGRKPDLSKKHPGQPAEVRFVFSKDDLELIEKAKKTSQLIKIVALFPDNIGKTTDSSNRAGCYIVKAK